MSARTARIQRDTRETQIEIEIDLDGSGCAELETGLPFLEHMLDQVARHGMLDLKVKAQGDLSVDAHHTVEDIGIVLGQAVRQALGDKQAIRRYGHAYVPLDEALSRVEKYVDQALLGGVGQLRVIHGHGTGQLRRAIAGFLDEHPLVATFEAAAPEHGGRGVTVIELKD